MKNSDDLSRENAYVWVQMAPQVPTFEQDGKPTVGTCCTLLACAAAAEFARKGRSRRSSGGGVGGVCCGDVSTPVFELCSAVQCIDSYV